MFPPSVYLMLALALSGPVTYGVMWIKQQRAVAAAYAAGKVAGSASISAAGVKGAEETAKARREAEAETPPVPADKAALIKLCKRSTSCRERGELR